MAKVKIEDLEEKVIVEDSNLIIVEDNDDTKKTTVRQLKNLFNGDNITPSRLKFYSSEKVNELVNAFDKRFSTVANQSELEEVKNQVSNIVSSTQNNPGKDIEIVQARNSFPTLSDRLENDEVKYDTKYVQKSYRSKSGNPIKISDHVHNGYIDIIVSNIANKQGDLIVSSRNLLDMSINTLNTDSVEYTNNGFKYTQITNGNSKKLSIDIKTDTLDGGTYYFYSNINFSDNFKDRGKIYMYINYADGSKELLEYSQQSNFMFTPQRPFVGITLEYHDSEFEQDSYVVYSNLMFTKQLESKYIPYYNYTNTISAQNNNSISISNFYNDDYDYRCTITDSIITLNYYNNLLNIDYLSEKIEELDNTVNNKIDHCGLMENYGNYFFFTDAINLTKNNNEILYTDKYIRNGESSATIYINKNAQSNPMFYIETDIKDNIDFVSLMYYVDKDVINTFTDNDGIRIYLTSDPSDITTPVNYFLYNINRNEMIQGWNCTKKKLSQFNKIGIPDENNINRVFIEINRNNNLNGKSIHFNSIIFNQRMKPTILLNFDSVYTDSTTYTYPLLQNKEIPFTVFANNSTPLSSETLSNLVSLWIEGTCDIGAYGCHPNKELLTEDNNPREQYLALKDTKNWLEENIYSNPVSYSAPYGNLRPITVPILRNLGYGIVRTSEEVYCSFFSNKDLCIPTFLISNLTTSRDIKDKIDFAIETGQTIGLFTNDVTEYGSESSANRIMFESIMEYIVDRMKNGLVQCLTFKDFYNKCVGGER